MTQDLTSPILSEDDWDAAWEQYDKIRLDDQDLPEAKARLHQLMGSEFLRISTLSVFSFHFEAYEPLATNPMALFWIEGPHCQLFCKLMNDALWLSIKFELERMVAEKYDPQRVVEAYRAGWAAMRRRGSLDEKHFLKDPPDKLNNTSAWKAMQSVMAIFPGEKTDYLSMMFLRTRFFKAFRDSLGETMEDNAVQRLLGSLLP